MTETDDQPLQTGQEYVDEQLIPFIQGEKPAADLVGLSFEDLVKLTQLGVSSYSAGLLDKAIEVFDLIVDLSPRYYVAHHYIGMIEEQCGNLEAASVAYERTGLLLEELPFRTPAQEETLHDVTFMMGRALLCMNQPADAALYLMDLHEKRDSLNPELAAHVAALLKQLGMGED